MRVLLALIYNGLLAVKGLLALPLRLIRRRRRPQLVRYSLQGDPPYLYQRRRRQLFRRKGSPSEVRSLEELRAQFKQLIVDPGVRGVVVMIEQLRASAAKREAVADLFRQMRSAGKLVVGYAVHLTNGEYELLCSADRIVLFSSGRLELTGFMAEATALGLALQRAGIAAHFVRRGQYKTAPEGGLGSAPRADRGGRDERQSGGTWGGWIQNDWKSAEGGSGGSAVPSHRSRRRKPWWIGAGFGIDPRPGAARRTKEGRGRLHRSSCGQRWLPRCVGREGNLGGSSRDRRLNRSIRRQV